MTIGIRSLDELFGRTIPEPNSGCWLWSGSVEKNGYARIGAFGRYFLAHRLAYELSSGPIRDGYQIDHICRVRSCCNPDHLRAVTCRENLLCGETHAARNAVKTHCHRGHPLFGDNLKLKLDRSGREKRICRECENINQRARRAARAS